MLYNTTIFDAIFDWSQFRLNFPKHLLKNMKEQLRLLRYNLIRQERNDLMTREKYESLPLATLKDLAKARKMRGISGMKKGELIDAMLALDEKEKQKEASEEAKEDAALDCRRKKKRRISSSWTAVIRQTAYLRCSRTAMDSSEARIIFRERMMSMCLRPRSEDSD